MAFRFNKHHCLGLYIHLGQVLNCQLDDVCGCIEQEQWLEALGQSCRELSQQIISPSEQLDGTCKPAQGSALTGYRSAHDSRFWLIPCSLWIYIFIIASLAGLGARSRALLSICLVLLSWVWPACLHSLDCSAAGAAAWVWEQHWDPACSAEHAGLGGFLPARLCAVPSGMGQNCCGFLSEPWVLCVWCPGSLSQAAPSPRSQFPVGQKDYTCTVPTFHLDNIFSLLGCLRAHKILQALKPRLYMSQLIPSLFCACSPLTI